MASNKDKGITAWVLRDALGDSTRGGVSGDHDRLTIVGVIPEGKDFAVTLNGPFGPTEDAPPVAIDVRNIMGHKILSVVPVQWDEDRMVYAKLPGWFMMGGNYLAPGDSRVGYLVEQVAKTHFYGAIAIHDRNEDN